MKDQGVDIIWGLQGIADELGVSIKTVQRLIKEEGLPINRRGGKYIQTTRQALQEWAQPENGLTLP